MRGEDAEDRLDGSISAVAPEGKKKMLGDELRDPSFTLALFLGDPAR